METPTSDNLRPYVHELHVVREPDHTDADLSWLTDESRYAGEPPEDVERYMEQDRERIAAYNRGGWHMMGVYAEAQIRFATPQGGWTQGATVRTPGIWNVESDSDDAYVAELGDEQLAELREMLAALGISIDVTADDVPRVDS